MGNNRYSDDLGIVLWLFTRRRNFSLVKWLTYLFRESTIKCLALETITVVLVLYELLDVFSLLLRIYTRQLGVGGQANFSAKSLVALVLLVLFFSFSLFSHSLYRDQALNLEWMY